MDTDAASPFAELLAPGEQVCAVMAGEGTAQGNGRRTWVQLALTRVGAGTAGQRLLAVVLVQTPDRVGWMPSASYTAHAQDLRLARFPRTPQSTARLEVHGLPAALEIDNIDDQAVFPQLEPFLTAWSGLLDGAGVVHQRVVQDNAPTASGPDPKLLLLITGVVLGLAILCCSGTVALSLLRSL
ncbi:MAG: hypothetical protein GXP62_12950 [Oligoflexia bacterium]|nr:hypothetical protein [Oligoflexia bacterium]